MPDQGSAALESIWRWLQGQLNQQPVPPLLLVIGLGGGGLLEVLDQRSPGTKVLALEPDPLVWQRTVSMSHVDVWRRNGRLVYLSGPAYSGADDAWRVFPSSPDSYKLIVDPRLSKGSAANLEAARVMKRIVFGVRANAEARRRFAPQYLTNVLRNLPSLARGHDVRALTGAFQGLPALIVAAGPSLDTVIDRLPVMRNRALIVAADTALRPLLNFGVAPHLAVGVDPGAWNARHFHGLPECPDTWLVCESALEPSAIKAFEARRFWFRVGDHQPWPWLRTAGIDVGYLDVWGSVLTAGFQVASLAGCDPIVIVGADLAYTGDRPYCRGTTYEYDWATANTWGMDLASSWQSHLARAKKRIELDVHGRETVSTASMLSFRDWMVARAKRSGRRVINATGAGILHGDGIEQLSLSDALPDDVHIPSLQTFASTAREVRLDALASDTRTIRNAIGTGVFSGTVAEQWLEFAGEGFDPVAVQSALDELVASIRTAQEGSAAPLIVQPQLGASEFTRRTLTGLPEALARFGAGLRNAPLPDAVATHIDAKQRSSLLGEGLLLLKHICTIVLRAVDVDPIADLSAIDNYIVSGAYKWPETTKWLILGFEGLLGRAWSSRVSPSAMPSVFSDGVRALGVFDSEVGAKDGSHAYQACLTLANQWIRCVSGLSCVEGARLYGQFLRSMSTVDVSVLSTGSPRQLVNGALIDTPCDDDPPGWRRLLARPRDLTGDGLAPSVVQYATPRGAVCVTPYAMESFVVSAEGVAEPHLHWPRPIVAELPMGPNGAVAWGNGLGRWPDTSVQAAYVMFRSDAHGQVTIEEVPVRPTFGVWWHDRLFLDCYPTPLDSWTGVASWTPGQLRLEVPGLVLYGMHVHDGALEMHPCEWVTGTGYKRGLRASRGWSWPHDGHPGEMALTGDGPVSSTDVAHGWTAVAYPEADRILFRCSDGRRTAMACSFPLRVAWCGTGLLVSTGTREVLLFEDVKYALDHLEVP